MKISMFTDTYFPQVNGVTYTVSLWKNKLENRGHEVNVFFPSSSYSPQKNEFGVKSISVPFYDGYKLGLPNRLKTYIEDTDIIHTHSPFSMGGLGAYYSKKLDIPRINSYHTPIEDYVDYLPLSKLLGSPLVYLYYFWEKRFMNSSETVTVPSSLVKDELNEKGIEDVFVLRNGVDTDFFKPSEKTFKKEYDSNYLIGYSGRHSKEKNLVDLINLSEVLSDTEILIGGDGPYRKKYEKMARDKNNVHFLGFLDRDKLPNFYSSLDVFVFPSLAETQGLVALESNACGTPVVGTNEKALVETIREGYNGYNYEPNDISDLKEKIEKIINKKEEMSKKAIEYSKQHSVEETIDQLINHYRRIYLKNEANLLHD